MSDANKWIASARVSLYELNKLCKWQRDQRVQSLVQVDDLEKEVERLRDAIRVATMDLEEPNMHEETRKDLLDMLKGLIE